jgi:glycerophosphoryl diester phosphodiesterase
MAVQIVGHRGAAGVAPENTMPSFEAAWAQRAGEERSDGVRAPGSAGAVAWVETDVRLTSDGVPVLLHDGSLERTTTGQGSINGLTWAEVQTIDAGARFGPGFAGTRVPRLEELLAAAAGRSSVLIELKAEVERPDLLIERALAAITAAHASGWVRLISFEPDLLERARRAMRGDPIPTGFIASTADGLIETAARLGCAAVHPRYSALSPALLAEAQSAGLRVNTWTLNDPDLVREAATMGVDEITTDFPVLAMEALGSAE